MELKFPVNFLWLHTQAVSQQEIGHAGSSTANDFGVQDFKNMRSSIQELRIQCRGHGTLYPDTMVHKPHDLKG